MLTHGVYGGIFIMGILRNFYTKWGKFLTSRTGIPGGPASIPNITVKTMEKYTHKVIINYTKKLSANKTTLCLKKFTPMTFVITM